MSTITDKLIDEIFSAISSFFDGTKIGYYIGGIILGISVYCAILTIVLIFVKKAVAKHPTYENAQRFYAMLRKPLMSINNNPDDWNEYRNIFHRINNSSQVPTELKIKIKNKLQKKKLHLGRTQINDNYPKTNTYGIK